MDTSSLVALGLPGALATYAYGLYPLILKILAGRGHRVPATGGAASGFPRHGEPLEGNAGELPYISISVPVYNEQAQIRELLESLLRIDYPAERRQILIISDASTDDTDHIVAEYADRGVELLRLPERRGKTAAEAAGAALLRGEMVINTDASIRIAPDAVRKLLAPFRDSTVGLVSGRDVSVSRGSDANAVETGYVGYEMWVRRLETQAGGIIGASGCFYAIRAHLHRQPLPAALSRDFASALIAREHGYRAVSADGAICFVPRTGSPQREYRRKVRTIMRGMETLAYKRHLLNPFRHPQFAWQVFSHKVCRWLLPWTAPTALLALGWEARAEPTAALVLAVIMVLLGLGVAAWRLSEHIRFPRPIAMLGYLLLGNVAVLHATLHALHGDENPVWEPTRRTPLAAS